MNKDERKSWEAQIDLMDATALGILKGMLKDWAASPQDKKKVKYLIRKRLQALRGETAATRRVSPSGYYGGGESPRWRIPANPKRPEFDGAYNSSWKARMR